MKDGKGLGASLLPVVLLLSFFMIGFEEAHHVTQSARANYQISNLQQATSMILYGPTVPLLYSFSFLAVTVLSSPALVLLNRLSHCHPK
jgi:hypothetical protein